MDVGAGVVTELDVKLKPKPGCRLLPVSADKGWDTDSNLNPADAAVAVVVGAMVSVVEFGANGVCFRFGSVDLFPNVKPPTIGRVGFDSATAAAAAAAAV